MTAPALTARSAPARLLAHARDPMHRNAYALIIGSGVTSVLGMAFWAAAARWYAAAAVGTAAALIAAVGFLANMATLGLRNGLVRFLGASGPGAPRLVRTAYLVCSAAAAAAAGIFVLAQPAFSDELDLVRDSPLTIALIVVGTVAWMLFILEDHVLTGLRQAVWVPIANGASSVVKIGLLAALAWAATWAVFAAYVVPAGVCVVVVGWLVFRRLLPRYVESAPPAAPLSVRDLVRFAAGDHLSAVLWLATTELMTLVVLEIAGAEASAYYYIAFTIGYTLYLVTSNVGSAFVAEAAHQPERVDQLYRAALANAARLVVPLAVIGCIAAPYALDLLGERYEHEGTTPLRLMLLSAVPQMVVGLRVSLARFQRRIATVVAIYAAIAVGVFGGGIEGLGRWGLPGVAMAWLLTMTVLAAFLGLSRPVVPRYDRWLRRPVRWASRARQQLQLRHRRRDADEVLPGVLAACGLPSRPDGYRLLRSTNDTVVARLRPGPVDAVVKVAMTDAASRGVAHHAEILTWLAECGDPRLPTGVLPSVLFHGEVEGRGFVVETALPGRQGRRDVDAASADHELLAAAQAFAAVHRATSRATTVDDAMLAAWVDRPVDLLLSVRHLAGRRAQLEAVRRSLREALGGRQVTVACHHGDCWLGNVLFGDAGPDGTPSVTGIVDWEDARRDGLPEVDLVHLWLTAQPGELGDLALAALSADEQSLEPVWGALGVRPPNAELPRDVVVLLAWLDHVSAGVRRATQFAPSRVWLARNVEVVLAGLPHRLPAHQGARTRRGS